MTYPGLFKSRYGNLKGRNWLQTIDPDDRRAFVEIGHKESQWGRLGGLARAQGPRNSKGRFIKLDKES
jgi:hypothetical protein